MIVFYDASGTPQPLSAYEDFSIKHKLDGCDEMTFCVDTRHPQYKMLCEEARVVTDSNEWLIKKIDDDKIDCELNFDFLKTTVYANYKSATRSLSEVLESHLPSGWTVEGANVSSIRRTIEFDFCTDYDVVYECMTTYSVYFVWKIKEKRLVVYASSMMQSTGEYLTSELNLTELSFKGDTTEFATRLYAYGKDGMTLEDAVVDGEKYGLKYVENTNYVDKVVCAYWSDERYTVSDNLYDAAKEKLKTLAYPARSYECTVVDHTGVLEAGTNSEVGSIPKDLSPVNSVATAGLQGSTNTCSAWVQNTGKIWLRPHAKSAASDAFEFMLVYNRVAEWS